MAVGSVGNSGSNSVEQVKTQERQQAADQARRDTQARDTAVREQQASRNSTAKGEVDMTA
jgi:hypothetical protein